MVKVIWGWGRAATVIAVLAFSFACDSGGEEQALEVAKKAEQETAQVRKEAEKAKQELEAFKRLQAAESAGTAVRDVQASGSAAGALGVASAAAPAVKPGEYSLTQITPVAEKCKLPSVMLAAVSNNVYEKADFVWTFAIQALYAHPEFVLGNKVSLKLPGRVALQQVEVNAKTVGLVAHCKDAATCNELAAMYKTTVPTSKPEVYCEKKWEGGSIPSGLLNSVGLKAIAYKKLQEEPTSMCARVGICTKQQNPMLPGDPGMECQRTPGKYKFKCGQQKTCKAVVECTQG